MAVGTFYLNKQDIKVNRVPPIDVIRVLRNKDVDCPPNEKKLKIAYSNGE